VGENNRVLVSACTVYWGEENVVGVMLETGVQMLRGEPKWYIRREVRGGEVGGCCGWDRRL
jgi:hypothetical protein